MHKLPKSKVRLKSIDLLSEVQQRILRYAYQNSCSERTVALHLVNLNVPLACLLPLLELVLPDDALLLRDLLEHVGDARHHALKSAEIHVRAVVHAREDLVLVLLHLVLDVHLAALGVGLLARERVGDARTSGTAQCRYRWRP